jgi:hypothetical protein
MRCGTASASVAVSLVESGLKLRTVAFVGWLGPRGLASIVFALRAVESLSRRTGCRDPAECYRDDGGPECPGSRTAPPWAKGDGAWVNTTFPTVKTVKSVAPPRRHCSPEVRPSGFKVEEVP